MGETRGRGCVDRSAGVDEYDTTRALYMYHPVYLARRVRRSRVTAPSIATHTLPSRPL